MPGFRPSWWTLLVYLHLQECHNLPSTSQTSTTTSSSTSSTSTSPAARATPDLSVSLWRAYPDTAVFDWLIPLQEKQAMVSCSLSYGLLFLSNQTWLVENFLPQHRSFNLHPLEQNTSYWFTMLCTDSGGEVHTSRTIHFTTGLSNTSVPRVGARYSHRRGHDYQESVVGDQRSKLLLTVRSRDKVSPHTILGVGCGLVGLLLTTVTSGLIVRKYHKYKTEMEAMSIELDLPEGGGLKGGESREEMGRYGEGWSPGEGVCTISLHCHCHPPPGGTFCQENHCSPPDLSSCPSPGLSLSPPDPTERLIDI